MKTLFPIRRIIFCALLLSLSTFAFPHEIKNGVLTIAQGTKEIRTQEFYGNKDIKTVVFPSSVTGIGSSAFKECTGLKKIVIPGNVKTIADNAFAGCTGLEEVILEEGVETISVYSFYNCKSVTSVTLPLSLKKVAEDNGIFWQNKSTRVFHCHLGSIAYNLALKNGFEQIDITGIDWKNIGSVDMNHLSLSANKTIKANFFREVAFKQIDLNNDITEIGKNAFSDKTTLRVKRNTYGDRWAKENGYYLSGVLADLNIYTKDKSKKITEDFSRILCDDTPYAEWTSYSFNTQNPLKLEEIEGKLFLTSFMLYPCKNVTVTTKSGKVLIKNKTIQPLSRTVLCDFDFLSDSVENFTLSTDDQFYKKLASIPVKWNISFNGFVRRESTSKDNLCSTMLPVHAREWIALAYDMAYTIGLPEYEKRCYNAVKAKTLATNEALTQFLTKEQMDSLLKKARDFSLVLGRCKGGFGLGGGNMLYLDNGWLLGIAASKNHVDAHAFYHEFSHCMGWGHEQGNMCNLGCPKPWGENCWPAIASKLYVEELEKGKPPYIEGKTFFNSVIFSNDKLNPTEYIADDIVKGGKLYIADGMPCADDLHKKQTDFTSIVFPSSVQVIKGSAFYETKVQSVTFPNSLKQIKALAFYNCTALKSLTIPDSVTEIGNEAFNKCSSLSSVKIGSGLRMLNSRVFKATGLKEITIPKTVKAIGKEAFADCKNLQRVVIEEGVKKIDSNAFTGTYLTEIDFPKSVTIFGDHITEKDVVWIVSRGSAAFNYAVNNNYPFKVKGETEEDAKAAIIAEGKNAALASSSSWKSGDFTVNNVRRRWDFSSSRTGEGVYTVTFKYTGGACKLSLSDALFVADGKGIAYFKEERSAGANPNKIEYSFSLPKGAKSLELYALVHTAGGTESNGTITVAAPDTMDNTALERVIAEGKNAVLASSSSWKPGDFTASATRRRWDFSSFLKGEGQYTVTFKYTGGACKLALSDAVFVADGKPLAYFKDEKSAGANPNQIEYIISVPAGTRSLELYALAHTGGGTQSNGVITVSLPGKMNDAALEKAIAEGKNAALASSSSWKPGDFTASATRRRWDFSSFLKGEGQYTVTFKYTGGACKLSLSDAVFVADGKQVAYFNEERSAGASPNKIVYTFTLPSGTKKLELYALAHTGGGTQSNGTITVTAP